MDFRFKVIQQFLKQYHADGLLLISEINRQWYTNNNSDFGFVLITKSNSYVYVDSRDYDTFRQNVKHAQVALYKDFKTWSKFITTLKLKKILIEANELTLLDYDQFIKPLKNIKFIRFNANALRIIKSPNEIKNISKACDIVCLGLNHIRQWLKPGMNEKQVANELLLFMIKHGASGSSFSTIVAFGDRTAKPHSTPTDRVLKNNDIVLVDCGCKYNGYCSDITRTWFVGTPNVQLKQIYQSVLTANQIGIKHARANITGKALDKIVRNAVRNTWNKNYDIPHGVGHGVGLRIHEDPRVNKVYDLPLPINSVVTIEPGIYLNKLGGIRVEDLIVITKTGCKVLTRKCPK